MTKNRNYKFKENQLQNGEYFEIGIPKMKYPHLFAFYLYNFVYTKIPLNQYLSKDRSPGSYGSEDEFDYKEWLDFYWIANYFGEDDVVRKATRALSKKYKDMGGFE